MATPGRRAEGQIWASALACRQSPRPGSCRWPAAETPKSQHIFAGFPWIYRAFARDGPNAVFPQG
jgi:hypothetical protein